MNTDQEFEIEALKKKITELEAENQRLRLNVSHEKKNQRVVTVPKDYEPLFDKAEELVAGYFEKLQIDPSRASILIDDERYVLMRASSLSIDFLEEIKSLYADKGEDEAIRIGQNFLFDISHVIGLEDARAFHKKMNLNDPVSKLSAGPIHFAYSGWASVEILDSNPSPDDRFFLKYNHPHSFEAESWIKHKKVADRPVCTMNSGYSSGWCEESFGVPLTAIEISCRAKGDDCCTFIMAHPDRIGEYLEKEAPGFKEEAHFEVPHFFERKKIEQEIIKSLEEKSILLQEIHHRVKNNLQLISSLLNLQSYHLKDQESIDMFNETKNRIKAIALVHEKLYQSSDVEHVNLKEYLQSIMDLLKDSIGGQNEILLDINSSVDNRIAIDTALPCGLILNELISNSIKYAFPESNTSGNNEILITITEVNQNYTIVVSDNGVGLPDGFSLTGSDSLGFDIILALVDQINGSITFKTTKGKGTSFSISFQL